MARGYIWVEDKITRFAFEKWFSLILSPVWFPQSRMSFTNFGFLRHWNWVVQLLEFVGFLPVTLVPFFLILTIPVHVSDDKSRVESKGSKNKFLTHEPRIEACLRLGFETSLKACLSGCMLQFTAFWILSAAEWKPGGPKVAYGLWFWSGRKVHSVITITGSPWPKDSTSEWEFRRESNGGVG